MKLKIRKNKGSSHGHSMQLPQFTNTEHAGTQPIVFGQHDKEVRQNLLATAAIKRNVWFVVVLPLAIIAATAWIIYALAFEPTNTFNASTLYQPANGKVYSGGYSGQDLSNYQAFLNITGQPSAALFQQFVKYPSNFNYPFDRFKERPAVGVLSLTLFDKRDEESQKGYCYSGGKPCRPASTTGSVARGDIDQYIVDRAAQVRSYAKPLFIRMNWEMNGTWFPFSAYGRECTRTLYNANQCKERADNGHEEYRDSWRRAAIIFDGGTRDQINARLAKQGMPALRTTHASLPATTNVSWVWNAAQGGLTDPHPYYPGDEFVDWVGIDWYANGNEDPDGGASGSSLFSDQQARPNSIYDRYSGPASPGKKPFMLGEWAMWGSDNPQWMTAMFNWIESHPQVKAQVYFNKDSSGTHELQRFPKAAAVYRDRIASSRYVKDYRQVVTAINSGSSVQSPQQPTPTPTTPTQTTTVKGDTSTAEPRLLNDSNVLWAGTFDHPTDWKSSFGISKLSFEENIRIGKPSFAIDNNLMHVITPGSSNRTNKWGVDLRTDFTKMGIGPQEAAYLRYYVYLPSNYACEGGGKFPGLSGITEGDSPSSTSSGGNYSERNWSGRLYWKQDVSGQNGCGMVSYMYVKHANGKYISNSTGRYVGIAPRWYNDASSSKGYSVVKKGQWNVIEVYYKMNTPGQNNGIHKAWLNGNLALNLNDVQYRTANHPNLKINQIFSSIFYGGSIFPATTQHSYFDSFVLSKSYIGPRTATSTPQPAPTTPTNPTPVPEDPVPPEANPVNLTLKGLIEGQSVSGTMKVEAVPQNAPRVQKVDFYVDTAFINSEGDAPYSLGGDTTTGARGWDTKKMADGQHTLRVVMTYDGGKKYESKTAFTIRNNANSLIQAENASALVGASTRNDSSASGGKALVLWNRNSSVSHTFTVPTTGAYSIGGVLKSQNYRGVAKVDIYLDGRKVTSKDLTTDYREYDLDNRTFTAGSKHTIKYVFVNDLCGYQSVSCSFSTDRNVWVDTLYLRR